MDTFTGFRGCIRYPGRTLAKLQIVWIMFSVSIPWIRQQNVIPFVFRSILFLTDGVADDVTDLVKRRNVPDISATVFSYTLGDGADTTVPWKVANVTGGIYAHIDDGDDNLLTAMSSYYLYYAFGDASDNSDVVVTSPYLDFSTKVAMITMALPVYFEEHFIGVLGIDLPLNVLSEAIGEVTLGRRSYSFVVNGEEEVILHPLVADPLTAEYSVGDQYNPVYISNLEPAEFDVANMMSADEGSQTIEGTVMSPVCNGLLFLTARFSVILNIDNISRTL